jgi:LCP family protein required for cell wall assembly
MPTPPRRRSGTLKKVIIGLLSVAVIGVFAAIGFLLWTNSKIDRIPAAELGSLSAVGDGPRTILVVGSDSRENLPDDLEGSFGSFSGQRTDVIMLVHLTPGEGAQLLSIPRDLKVTLPHNGETNRVNAAFAFGGPDLLVQTLQAEMAVEINNYIEIDFGGFARVVDALGGVTLDFPNPARDRKSGLQVEAGTQTLDGAQALAYVRSRSYQELRNGSWTSVAANDIGRTQRQQRILLALFDEVSSRSNAFSLPNFASTFAEQIRADASLDLGVLVELGRAGLALDSADIQALTLPVAISNEGGRSYVVRVEPDAQSVIDAFNAGEPFPVG